MRPGPRSILQPLVRIDLAVFRGLRLVAQRELHVGFVEGFARHQLIGPRSLHRVDNGWSVQISTLAGIFSKERLAEADRNEWREPRRVGNERQSRLG